MVSAAEKLYTSKQAFKVDVYDFSVNVNSCVDFETDNITHIAEVLTLEGNNYRSLGIDSMCGFFHKDQNRLKSFEDKIAKKSVQEAVKMNVLKPEQTKEFKKKIESAVYAGLSDIGTKIAKDIQSELRLSLPSEAWHLGVIGIKIMNDIYSTTHVELMI